MSTSAKKLHPDFLDEVTRRIDIFEVVSEHIELKKRGKDYLGLCPFHGEKTPSFSVSPQKGLAYCFGCRWGGNAFKFLMELGKVSFADAVLELARSVGVPIQYEDGSTDDLPASSLQLKPRKILQQASDKKICQFDPISRDAAYRKLVGELDLALRHRDKLKRDRHLCDDQIDFAYQQGWLTTWQPGNNYHGISRELAGIDPKTGKLTGVDGIAIAALNPANQVTGFQLAPDNREKFGKYIWVSSKNQGGSSPHLPNGELPIFCWRHPDAPLISEVWLCEGALKSLLVALRLWFVEGRSDVVVIGSASSARYGDETLRDCLAQLGANTIRLIPDAGAVANPGISSANGQTLKWLQQWGYKPEVGWWGQLDKSHSDIDELEDWGAITYISPQDFLGLGEDASAPRKEPQAEPNSDAYTAHIAWEEEQEAIAQLNYSEPTAEDLWKLLHVPNERQLTDRLTLSDEALQADFLCIKSPMCSGKTYTMAQVCATVNSLLIVVNTIALGEALARRYNCTPYNHPKIKAGELSISNIDRLVITSESLWKIRTFHKKFDVVLIDEADQVLSSAVASVTTRRKRKEILTNLEYFAHQSKQFILMDADLSSAVVEFAQHLCDRKPYIVQNASIPHIGETFYQFESQDAHISYICAQLEQGNKVLIVTDSKKKVKSLGAYFSGFDNIEGVENLGQNLHEKFQKEFPDKKGIIIHGDNSGEEEIRELIKRINELLPILKLDYLIFNSCVQSGVSIEVVDELGRGYFQALACLWTGMTLPHTELGQTSHRWRPNDCEKSFSFSQAPTFNLETSVIKLERDLFDKHWEEVQSLGINAKSGMPDPEITKFRIQVEARRNWSLNKIQEAFKRHLEGMGYAIAPHPDEHHITGTDTFKEALKARGEIVDQALVATIINSPPLNEKAYKQLEKKPNPDYYDRATKIRYDLKDFTGMEPTQKLVEMWLEDDIRKKLTRLDFLFQPKQAAKIADLANRSKYHYVFDQRHNLLERQLLEALDATTYLDPTKVYTNTDLKPLEVACKAQAAKIKRLLKVTIYQPPQYLKRGLKEAAEGVKALFDASVQPLSKWLLGTLSTASFVALTKDQFKDTFSEQESANEICQQLSIPGQILCEALSVSIRHKISDMSPSKVHAALCEAVGLKREQASQNASGRGYQIKAESWAFAQTVLQHRQQQREQRQRQKEEAIIEEAARFTAANINAQQQAIEQEISHVIASTSIPPAQDLGYLHTPPDIYRSNKLGGVCESQGGGAGEQEYSFHPVNIGDEISVPCLGEMGKIAASALGRDAEFKFHDYIRFLPNGGGEKWIPSSWAQSPDGRRIRSNPIPDPNFIPLRSRQTWANWLLAMTDSNQLIKFEQRHTLAEIEGAISTLSAAPLLELQHKLAGWGIERSWLPPLNDTQDLISVLKLGLEMGVDIFKSYLGDLKQTLESSILRRTWQSLSCEMKRAIASLAPEAPGILLNQPDGV